jgi:hypothetical protein
VRPRGLLEVLGMTKVLVLIWVKYLSSSHYPDTKISDLNNFANVAIS